MAITHKFTRTLPAPIEPYTGGYEFILSTGWFTQAAGVAGSPIDGGANSIANGGGNMQAYADEACTARLPLYIKTFVTGSSPKAFVVVRKPSYATGDKITIAKDSAQTVQPVSTDTYGRDAVWQNYDIVMIAGDSANLTGKNTPTLSNITTTTGRLDQAWVFNGASSRIDIDLTANPTNEFEISAWAKPVNNTSNKTILGIANKDATNQQDRVYQTSTTLKVDSFGGSNVNLTKSSVTADDWHSYSYRLDQTQSPFEALLTVDGSTTVSGSASGTAVTTFNRLTVGTTADSTPIWWFEGNVEIIRASLLGKTANRRIDEYSNYSNPDSFGTSSEWVAVGGSQITVNDTTTTTKTNSNSDSILNIGAFNVLDNTASTKTKSNSDFIQLAAVVSIDDSLTTSKSNSNAESVLNVGAFNILDSTATTKTKSNQDSIQFGAAVFVSDSTATSKSKSNSDSVLLVGQFFISDATTTSKSNTASDLVYLSSTVSISDSITTTKSNTNNDLVLLVGEFNITDTVATTKSNSNNDSVSLIGEFVVLDSTATTKTDSNRDSVIIGEIVVSFNSETNYTQLFLSTTYTQPDLSRNYSQVFLSTNYSQ